MIKIVSNSQAPANSDDFNEDNSFLLWFRGQTEELPPEMKKAEEVASSEDYMGQDLSMYCQ